MKSFVITTFIAALLTGNCIGQASRSSFPGIIKTISINKNATIRVDNNKKNIEVKSWLEDKVKIVINGMSTPENTDVDDFLEKLGITLRQSGNTLSISIKEGANNYLWDGPSNASQATQSSPGNDETTAKSFHKIARYLANASKQALTLYIPQSAKLRMDSKYGNLSFTNSINDLDLDIINGNVDAQNISNLKLISKYGNFTCGDIKIGEVDFINGRFTANNTDDLELDTKYSNVEIARAKSLSFLSTNDEYVIDEAGEVKARKNYGSFRISLLNHSLELDGTNADIRIRNIAPSLKLIRLDDKYSDLHLPLKNVKNYSFEVTGTYNTVYSVNNFAGSKDDSGRDDAKVTGAVGNGNGANVTIKCQNCTIDLK